MEVFQDTIDKAARDAGPIFCEPLNGKMIGFPETIEEFDVVNSLLISSMKFYDLNEMAIVINAKSFATIIY